MKRARLLLVDDHVMFTEGLRAILSTDFAIVGVVEDGESALAASERLRPDVIVLDVSMPGLNGIEVARRLQSTETSAKIVFCAVHADPEFVKEAFHASAKGYIGIGKRVAPPALPHHRTCGSAYGGSAG